MKTKLSDIEARIIGCLIEKEITTPDHYPLTLNSLTSACNQKSSREPVMTLDESQVMDAVTSLIDRHLMVDESGFNSRVSKYRHRFCNTEFGSLQFNEQQRAIVCCLLLRGPQTPGELRTRTQRLCQFKDVHEVEEALEQLANHSEGILVIKLAKESGKREARFLHQFSDLNEQTYAPAETENTEITRQAGNLDYDARIAALEKTVEALQAQIDTLTEQLAQCNV